jgi:uncharacterized lipoprotein YddW (UPF0748 family)
LRHIVCAVLAAALVTGSWVVPFSSANEAPSDVYAYGAGKEMRGVWLAFSDFEGLGLANKSEAAFKKRIGQLFDKAQTYGTTDIFFHVRAFDDAAWKRATFKPSKYCTADGSSSGIARDELAYDPLQIVITEAHSRGMKLHAWLNPYRINHNYYYDPAEQSTTDRILTAVRELLKYKINGIHIDDYFYSAKKGYRSVEKAKKYKVSISAATKRKYCNAMVQAVYKAVHKKKGVKFGVSPAGNYGNAMACGADVKTWLSVKGYIDYAAPQIYWTDRWGSDGGTKMFSARLQRFKDLNTLGLPMYVGLALYRTGYKQSDDKGWGTSNRNIASQVEKLRTAGMDGYILFSLRSMYSKTSAKELKNLRKLLNSETKQKIIVIDAGHQKKADNKLIPIGPGSSEKRPAVSSGTRGAYTGNPEYKITLQVAKRLSKSLKKAGYKVFMVRTKNDVNISNKKRAEYANRKKADLVIRLHCDGIDGDSSVRGFLTLTPSKNKWTKKIYARSLKASKAIHKAALKATGAKSRGISKRGDLVGFNYSKVPVTLLEMGVMTNERDDRLLATAKYQNKIVKGVVNGVKAYFKN